MSDINHNVGDERKRTTHPEGEAAHRSSSAHRSAPGQRSTQAHKSGAVQKGTSEHKQSSVGRRRSAHKASSGVRRTDMHSKVHETAAHSEGHRMNAGDGKVSAIQKIKRVAHLLWTKYRFETIAVSVLILSVAVAIPVIIHAVNVNKTETKEVDLENYGDLFSADGQTQTTATTNSKGIRIRVDEETGEEIEDPTILAEVKGTGEGYLNNCIFLGDSRYVGLVSYAVISDEDVLAQVGIAHMSVESNTFTQNSGAQYTLRSYLQSHAKDVIYIGYGVNGMKGTDEDTYEKSYKNLIEHIMELAPNSKIVLMSIWPVDDNGTYKGSVKNEWIDKYNDFLLALAEYEGIYYLDVNTVLKDKNGSINSKYDGGDGLHYNAKGYQVIREYILSHPVPGVSDEGTYTVHYVAPKGQFKDMVKDAVVLPTAGVTEAVAESESAEPTPTPTPEPTKEAETIPEKEAQPTQAQPTPTTAPTPTQVPTQAPAPTQAANDSGSGSSDSGNSTDSGNSGNSGNSENSGGGGDSGGGESSDSGEGSGGGENSGGGDSSGGESNSTDGSSEPAATEE